MSDGASWGDSKEYKEAQTRASRNPFAGISDPATLRALVQGGAECEACGGTGGTWDCPCPDCTVGKTPLPNADLDALAACWCEGWEYHPEGAAETLAKFMKCTWRRPLREGYKENYFDWSDSPPAYTTSPDAAMRLQVKYHLDVDWLDETSGIVYEGLSSDPSRRHTDFMNSELEHAITTAALVVALTEAMEGDSDD